MDTRFVLCFSLLLMLFSCNSASDSDDIQSDVEATYNPSQDFDAIKAVMSMQEEAWSAGDLEQFMTGYINDETLTFIGSRGLSYGWETTLANYKKGYADKAAMGKLSFEVLELKSLSPEFCYMIGKFYLTRDAEDLSGYFTLLWQKIGGEWKVIADQTCG